MTALLHPRYDFEEYEELEELREIEIGRAPARPRLALVGEPRAAVRRSPRTTPATYRRRRIVAVLLALAVVVGVGRVGATLGGSPLVTPERPPASQSVDTYVVQPGDSLWSIAQAMAPGSDPRPLVDDIIRERGDAPLRPGEVVELPN
jgi:LysM domain